MFARYALSMRWGWGIVALVVAASCNSVPPPPENGPDVCGSPCTPRNPCAAHGTIGCDWGQAVGCNDSAETLPDGTACPNGFCFNGVCDPTTCVPNQVCTPPGDECHEGRTSCDPNHLFTKCTAAAALPDGTPCQGQYSCKAGLCSTTRIVTGAFTTTHEKDDLSRTTVPTPPPNGTTLSAFFDPYYYGVTLANDGTFTTNQVVPLGHYSLCMTGNGPRKCVERSADVVALDTLVAARPDLAPVTKSTPVTLNVTNADPFVVDTVLSIASAQGGVNLRPFQGGSAPPATSSTSFSTIVDWSKGSMGDWPTGLVDAAKGDVVYVSMAPPSTVGAGFTAAAIRHVTQYAKLTDMTVTDGNASVEAVPLVAAPQTGTASLDVRYSQWAALAPKMNPNSVPTKLLAEVLAHTYSINTQNFTGHRGDVSVLSLSMDLSAGTAPPSDGGVVFADYDYGSRSFGQFLGASWKEYSSTTFEATVSIAAPKASPMRFPIALTSTRPGSFSGPIKPALGPPEVPGIGLGSQNAFYPQAGVGTIATLGWLPPKLGVATSYVVRLYSLQNVSGATVSTLVEEDTLYTNTSVRFNLTPKTSYFATISARAAPWDVVDGTGVGVPFDSADCVTAPFIP